MGKHCKHTIRNFDRTKVFARRKNFVVKFSCGSFMLGSTADEDWQWYFHLISLVVHGKTSLLWVRRATSALLRRISLLYGNNWPHTVKVFFKATSNEFICDHFNSSVEQWTLKTYACFLTRLVYIRLFSWDALSWCWRFSTVCGKVKSGLTNRLWWGSFTARININPGKYWDKKWLLQMRKSREGRVTWDCWF